VRDTVTDAARRETRDQVRNRRVIPVVADTSGLLAALDSVHPEHHTSNEAIMAAGLLVMFPLLLAEIDHVATRELGREVPLSAVDDIRHWVRQGRIALPEVTEDHWVPPSRCVPGIATWTWTSRMR
jgi:hypothetical protein